MPVAEGWDAVVAVCAAVSFFAFCIVRSQRLSFWSLRRARWGLYALLTPFVGIGVFFLGDLIFGPFPKLGKSSTVTTAPSPAITAHSANTASSSPDAILIWTIVGSVGTILVLIVTIIALTKKR